MSNAEAAAYLVELYGVYRGAGKVQSTNYEQAIALACAALQGGDSHANANGSGGS